MDTRALQASVAIVCLLVCATGSIPASPQAGSVQSHSPVDSRTTNQMGFSKQGFETSGGFQDNQFQQPSSQLPNTLTIVSADDERVYYNATTSGRLNPGEQADLVDAEQPDTVTNTTASGSTAQGGSDTFRFTGQITALTLNGGPARVLINGRTVNPATIPDTAPANATTASLTIPSPERETTSYPQATIDVSGAIALDERGLRARFREHRLDGRFGATTNTTARQAELRTTATHIESRIVRLRERQSTVITAYNNGSLSDQEFLRSLARIDKAADGLATATDRVAARASSIPESSINGQPAARWARNKQIELSPLQGPVRNRIAQTLRGNSTEPINIPSNLDRIAPTPNERLEPLSVYIETSQHGIVLAMVDGGQYYREALLLGQRNATGSALNTTNAVRTQVGALYPWATNNSAYAGLSTDRKTRLAQYTLSHDHGQLTTLLNQSSGRVIAEQQRKSLSRMPTATSLMAAEKSFQLWVNRTYPTGPLDISLMTPEGQPIKGTIAINDRPIEQTGEDGQLWTITPAETLTIVAQANGETVRIRIPPHPRSNRSPNRMESG